MRWPWSRTPEVEQRTIDTVPWSTDGPSGWAHYTTDSALRLAPVYAAARLLADSVASLPLQTYRRVGDKRVRTSGAQLFNAPSVNGTVYDWLHQLMTSLVLQGNAYGMVTTRDGFGFPTGIEWLSPEQVSVQEDPRLPGAIRATFYLLGREIPREDLVHIRAFALPGRTEGVSPIKHHALLISSGLNALQYGTDWFDNGGIPPGTFRNTEKKVTADDSDIIRAKLVTAIRNRQPLVHGADWEYKPIQIPPEEAQFIATMRLNATQVASIYGIPPERIGGERGNPLTYSTQEQEEIAFQTSTIVPWVTRLEYAFANLLPERQYVKFNLDARIRTDLSSPRPWG
jgi:HK97 family phage portal protein